MPYNKEYAKQYRKDNKEKLIRYAKQYNQEHKAEKAAYNKEYYKQYYKNNKKKVIAGVKLWKHSRGNCIGKIKEFWRNRNNWDEKTLKDKCRDVTRHMRYCGYLLEATTCHRCGEKKPIENHHPNYRKPSLVVPVCKECHDIITFGKET
jgi:hypothetical protein